MKKIDKLNDKKIMKIRNIKNILIYIVAFVLFGLFSFNVFAEDGEVVKDYKTISIIFIIIDIVLFLIMYYLIKIYKSYRSKINTEKNLQVYTLGAFLAFTQGLFIVLVVLAVILFLSICEFSYLIHQSKIELKQLKENAQKRSEEINEMLKNGNISYVMTTDAWYEIEKENCDHSLRIGDSPILYLNKELKKEQESHVIDEARIGALLKLSDEYKDAE